MSASGREHAVLKGRAPLAGTPAIQEKSPKRAAV
jgi:hypothetical protein